MLSPVRVVEQAPFPDDVMLRSQRWIGMVEPFFNIAVDVRYVVGQRPMNRFSVSCWVEYIYVKIPAPEFYLESLIQTLPVLLGQSGFLGCTRHFIVADYCTR